MNREDTDVEDLDEYRSKRAEETTVNSMPIRENRNNRSTAQTIPGKETREQLLYALNETVAVLLTSPDDEDKFRDSVFNAMKTLGTCINLDRVCIWQSEGDDNMATRYYPIYEWWNSAYKKQKSVFDSHILHRFNNPEWTNRFTRGECISGIVKNFTKVEQELFSYNKLKSVLLIPINLQEKLWGFIIFCDCSNERDFLDEEINILRSASLIIISAIEHNIQTIKIKNGRQRTRLLLDANPLASVLWDTNYRVFDCNAEAIKMFGADTKNELLERYFDTFPEYQSDGSLSREAAIKYLKTAFDKGIHTFYWTHRTLDGTPVPSEVTVVRIPYKNEYAIAGYSRDLREHDRMVEEIMAKDSLLQTVTYAASILLQSDEEHFDSAMFNCMGTVAETINVDRVYLWKNHVKNGQIYSSQIYEWSGGAEPQQGKDYTTNHIFGEMLTVDEQLASGLSINAIVREMPPKEKAFFEAQNIKSILLLPIFIKDKYWGFVGFDDCHTERNFSESEESILRTGGLLMVDVILRNEDAGTIRRANETLSEQALWYKSLLDANPFAAVLWDKNYRVCDCNEEALKMVEARSRNEFIERYADTLPEYQTDGSRSIDAAVKHFQTAIDTGKHTFLWTHQTFTGEPVPSQVTLVRIPYNNEYAIAGYTRDLRNKIQMTQEIETKDKLLRIVNQAALILLSRDDTKFDEAMSKGLSLFAGLADIDRMSVFRNTEGKDGALYLSQIYRWRKDINGTVKVWDELQNIPISVNFPRLVPILKSGKCIDGQVSQLPDAEIFKKFGCVTILAVPVFDDGKFWGITLFDRITEKNFTEYEIDVLRSASFMLANAVIRHEEAETIRRANEQVQLMLDAAPFAVTMWDKNFRVIDCSQTALNVFGFSSKQDLIEHFVDSAPEYQPCGRRSMDILADAATEAFETGSCRLEWTGPGANGETIVFEDTAVRVKYNNEYTLMLYSRDIREEKKMLMELAERDKRLVNQAHWYKSLLDGIPVPISVTDNDMNITFTNMASVKAFKKMDRNALIGKHCSIWNVPICNTPDCSIVRAHRGLNQSFFKQNSSSFKVESQILKDLSGEPVGHLEILFDITEVENAARKEADAENLAKTNFLASMSHEMRTPLNAIMGLSELVLASDRLDEENQANLVKIHNAGATLLATVNDILDISKIEAGKLELIPTEYEVSSLINDAITQNAARVEEKPLEFILNIKSDLPRRLYGDELRSKEILNNLLSNAFKYTREGTIELGVRSLREGETVLVTAWVKDSGIGIKQEDIKSLFADYVQVNKESNRKIQGTGLGLAITKRLVELMDGTITVESEYGKGSVFTVTIKQKYVDDQTIGPDMVQNLKNFRYTERKRRQNLRFGYLNMSYARVLVVDDISVNLDVAKGMLKPYVMKVDCVLSGQEAINAIRDEKVKYDAIFMDHMMPGMDGIEAVRIIREEIGTEYARTIPIIALTANAIIGNEEKFLQAGFQSFISKPIDIQLLDSVLREWVRDEELEKKANEKDPLVYNEDRRSGNARRSGIDRRIFGNNLAGLDLAKGMERFGNNRETYLDMMKSFAAGTRPLLKRIENVDIVPLKDYTYIVHGIKGSSRGIGAFPLGDQAEALEHAAKNGDRDFMKANHPAFLAAANQLMEGIEEALTGQKKQKSKPKKDTPNKEILEKLLSACIDYDMDKADTAIAEIEKWEYEADDGLAAWLKENVDLMNFNEIVERLRKQGG